VRLIYHERSVKTVRVQLKPSYDVLIGKGLLATAGRRIERLVSPTHTFVVSSKRILDLHSKALSVPKGKLTFEFIPEGEESKSMEMAYGLLADFARLGADRRSCVIAFGGGVIGDLAGFAASIYMRGIPVVQVPTTLLAQVDAAIGGKTAVNFADAKNLVGTFHQPRLVIADTDVLSSLPEREFRAGIFEVIKCGIIRDPALFRYLEQNAEKVLQGNSNALMRIIASSVKVKADVVAADEKESDLRRILNFGHTIGHALEAATGYRQLLHGEAVGLGMIAAAEIGVNIGVTPEAVAERIIGCVLQYGPLPRVKADAGKVFRAIGADKKTVNARPHFVLIDKIGSTVIRNDVPDVVIKSAIRSVIA
jgi:3-dehydroquinate synthase